MDVEFAHTPLEIIHCKTVVPTVKPVTVVVGEFIDVTTPLPDTILHVPIPVTGVFAANVVLPVLTQIVWDAPAFETVGILST